MMDKIYKKIELVGTSPQNIEKAIENAIHKANRTVKNLSWFEVKEMRGRIENGLVAEWQVGLNLAFALEEGDQEDLNPPLEAAAAEPAPQAFEDVPTEVIRHQSPLK